MHRVKATKDGFVIRLNNDSLINKGEALIDTAPLGQCKLQQTCTINLLDVRDTPAEMTDDILA